MGSHSRSLLTLFFYLFSNLPLRLDATFIKVDASDPHSEKTIKSAISKAKSGDTVWVAGEYYHEGNITIDKAIYLFSDENAVLDGDHLYEIISIKSQGIKVSGFCLQNTGASSIEEIAAVHIYNTNHAIIQNNRIENAFFGILLEGASNCSVLNNKLLSIAKDENITGNGIHMWKCDSIYIDGNRVSGHRDGIYLEFVTNSKISHNISTKNLRYGLHFMFSHSDIYSHNVFSENGSGVAVMFSRNVEMNYNEFSNNWGNAAYGLLLKEISGGHINHNRFENNTAGAYFEGASHLSLRGNVFTKNGWALKIQASCENVKIDSNNFILNTFDVSTNGSLVLSNFSGNFWDKYEGYDLKHDGLGDVPYQPVSLYSMITENNTSSLLLLRSFLTTMLDRAEKVIPSITPINLKDSFPLMKPLPL